MFIKTSALLATLLLAADLRSAYAVDYLGGWLSSDPTAQCVDICSAPSATCLTSAADCLAKKKVPGDYDYLVLEQIFVPQFCRDLLNGVDSTISHQNVTKYPNGVACVPEVVKSELTIHGLWPNYNDGYVSCCNPSDSVANDPYNAADFAANQPALLTEMGEKWVDATQETTYDSLCEIYNHEFQKHGLCYAADGADYEAAAVTYFEATLNTAARISAATNQINEWAAQGTPETTLEAIEALYDKKVMVFCSNVDGTANRLSAIRTCYEKPANSTSVGPTTQINCATATATSTFSVCTNTTPVLLDAYVAPSSTPAPTTATPSPTTATPSPTTATPTPTTATPTPTPTTPTSPAQALQQFCTIFNRKAFCDLLFFCEWNSSTSQCDGALKY